MNDRPAITYAPPVTERYAVSFTYYGPRTPDGLRRQMWVDAKRRLAGDIFAKMLPNRSYTIRYAEQTRPAAFDDRATEGIITADITYSP